MNFTFLIFLASLSGADKFCSQKIINLEKFEKIFYTDYLNNNEKRIELLSFLSQNNHNSCAEFLNTKINNVLIKKENIIKQNLEQTYFLRDKNTNIKEEEKNVPYLLMAINAKLPKIQEAIEYETLQNNGDALLGAIKSKDTKAYYQIFNNVINTLSTELRNKYKLYKQDTAKYGTLIMSTNDEKREEINIPLANLFEKYLYEQITKGIPITETTLDNTNIFYALMEREQKRVFSDILADFYKKNETIFMQSFRKENPWVQAKLLGLFKIMNTSLIKRELNWISENHQDFKIKIYANQIFSDLMKK